MATPVLLSSSAEARPTGEFSSIGVAGTGKLLVVIVSGRIPFTFTFPTWRLSRENYKDAGEPPHPETDVYAFGPTWDRIEMVTAVIDLDGSPWYLWAEGEGAPSTTGVTIGYFLFDDLKTHSFGASVQDYVSIISPVLAKAPIVQVPDNSYGMSLYCALDADMKPVSALVTNPVSAKSFQAITANIVDNYQRGVEGEAYFLSADLPDDGGSPVYVPYISSSYYVSDYDPPVPPPSGTLAKKTRLRQRTDHSARPGNAGQNAPTSRQASSRIKGYGTYL